MLYAQKTRNESENQPDAKIISTNEFFGVLYFPLNQAESFEINSYRDNSLYFQTSRGFTPDEQVAPNIVLHL